MYMPFIDLVTCQFCALPRPAYIVPSDIVNAVFDHVQAEKQILTLRTGCRLYSLPPLPCPLYPSRPGIPSARPPVPAPVDGQPRSLRMYDPSTRRVNCLFGDSGVIFGSLTSTDLPKKPRSAHFCAKNRRSIRPVLPLLRFFGPSKSSCSAPSALIRVAGRYRLSL